MTSDTGAPAGYPRNLPRPPAAERVRPLIRDLSTENIAELAVRAREIGDVIPLWYGEGDLVTPAFIRDAAKAAFDAGQTFYVPDMRGAPALTQALAAYQTRLHGRPIARERSTVTPGGMQALALALQLVLDPGRNVVYLEPQWPNIANLIHLSGGEGRAVPLAFRDGDWRLDMDAVIAACDARTTAIVFSTPANPTGWTASREDLAALLAFGRERGIWIVSDEVYNRLYWDGPSAPSILEIAEDEDLVLSINSFSKAWAMTGWRVGWLVHPLSVAPQLAAMTQYMNSGIAATIQAGATVAIEQGEELVATMRERCREGVDLAYAALSQVPDVRLPTKPRGGMYVFFSLASEPDSAIACRRILEEAHVGLAPGWFFGAPARPYLRMCVARDPVQLESALDRMVAALRS
ncbi:pyridoxal phosphate-dependent aminotransferase [Salinarimonas ramus]|uniref:Aminotransferase n=1 Tax=Salinarimonas ramus TaxID=690164 RepID=A0A917Q4N8_9HYPH|nr:pyridoxal phosphate-dependent aminotransferase [Salinarimonas ramus]GGK21715.1 aminotransferase [Salinarimonas ramus]